MLSLALFAPQSRAVEKSEPMTALELVQAGQAAYGQRDYETAQAHFGTFLTDYGDSEEAQEAVHAVRPLFAICLIRVREFGEALGVIKQVLGAEGVDQAMRLELTFWQGVCQLQAADHAKAQVSFGTYYKHAPKTDPRRIEAAILFGTGYLIQEQYPDAIAFFRSRVEELEANAPEAAARMITLQLHALIQTDELEEAVALTLRASEKFDQFVQIIGLQSLILQLGNRDCSMKNNTMKRSVAFTMSGLSSSCSISRRVGRSGWRDVCAC